MSDNATEKRSNYESQVNQGNRNNRNKRRNKKYGYYKLTKREYNKLQYEKGFENGKRSVHKETAYEVGYRRGREFELARIEDERNNELDNYDHQQEDVEDVEDAEVDEECEE